jgi:hypothetical protein
MDGLKMIREGLAMISGGLVMILEKNASKTESPLVTIGASQPPVAVVEPPPEPVAEPAAEPLPESPSEPAADQKARGKRPKQTNPVIAKANSELALNSNTKEAEPVIPGKPVRDECRDMIIEIVKMQGRPVAEKILKDLGYCNLPSVPEDKIDELRAKLLEAV